MTCDDVRGHWSLYHDSEGDPELHWRVSEHLGECAPCAEWFAKQSRLEGMLAEKLAEGPKDEEMWDRVLARVGIVEPVVRRRWFLFSTLAACAAALLMAVGVWWTVRPTDDRDAPPSLAALSAALHDGLATGATAVAIASESDLAVEDFLRKEVSFPVRCPPRKDSGFAVRGARTCRLGSEPVAIVVGDVDGTPVSIFILSRDSLAAFPRQRAALEAEAVHTCREGDYEMALSIIDRNIVLVVGGTQPESLKQVLQAYGSYPHDQAG